MHTRAVRTNTCSGRYSEHGLHRQSNFQTAPAALAADAGAACCAWGRGSTALASAGPAPTTRSER
jgi:hypothetical protein